MVDYNMRVIQTGPLIGKIGINLDVEARSNQGRPPYNNGVLSGRQIEVASTDKFPDWLSCSKNLLNTWLHPHGSLALVTGSPEIGGLQRRDHKRQ